MQSYPIKLTAGEARTIQTTAERFVYESGVNAIQGGDSRIIVQPNNGNEIVLRAGQSFRLPEGQHATGWTVKPYDPTATINGFVIIGSGEFDDNSFKIDANSGAVPVTPSGGWQIANTAANRVPVTLDTAQILKIEAPIMKFTKTVQASPNPQQSTPLLTAVENVNGAIIEGWAVGPGSPAPYLSTGALNTGTSYGAAGSNGGLGPVVVRLWVQPGQPLYACNLQSAGGSQEFVTVFLTVL